jgi:hypothetical protein
VNPLDEIWAKMVSEGLADANAAGRRGAADYLELRALNDKIRATGVRWLLDSVIEAAFESPDADIRVERTEPHQFLHKGANIVGTRLRLTFGVRCLTVEAGWTRTPSDGFMRGGALAFAKFSHFGLMKEGLDASLLVIDDSPAWIDDSHRDHVSATIDIDTIRRHIRVLKGE